MFYTVDLVLHLDVKAAVGAPLEIFFNIFIKHSLIFILNVKHPNHSHINQILTNYRIITSLHALNMGIS